MRQKLSVNHVNLLFPCREGDPALGEVTCDRFVQDIQPARISAHGWHYETVSVGDEAFATHGPAPACHACDRVKVSGYLANFPGWLVAENAVAQTERFRAAPTQMRWRIRIVIPFNPDPVCPRSEGAYTKALRGGKPRFGGWIMEAVSEGNNTVGRKLVNQRFDHFQRHAGVVRRQELTAPCEAGSLLKVQVRNDERPARFPPERPLRERGHQLTTMVQLKCIGGVSEGCRHVLKHAGRRPQGQFTKNRPAAGHALLHVQNAPLRSQHAFVHHL